MMVSGCSCSCSRETRGAIRITDNASRELVDMPRLVAIDPEFVLTGDPKLALVEAAQLQPPWPSGSTCRCYRRTSPSGCA